MIVFCALFTSAVCAAENEWAFDSLEKLNAWTADSQMLQYEIKNGKCEFALMGKAPYISHVGGLDFSEYKYAVVRAMSDTEKCNLKLVVETSDGSFPFEIELNGDGAWHEYIVKIDVGGTADKITLYFLSNDYADKAIHVVIDRIGFFKTKSDGEYFLSRALISLKEPEKTVSSGLTAPSWLFSSSTDISKWSVVGEVFNQVGMMKIIPSGNDFSLSAKLTTPFQAEEFKYFALRCKSLLDCDSAYITFNSDIHKSYFVLKNDGEWHNYIIDMSKYAHRKWSGTIADIALAVDGAIVGDELYLERLGFFSNYNDASDFLRQSTLSFDFTAEMRYDGDNYKITVPADTMAESYTLSDILVKNLSGKSGGQTTVVLSNNTPIPLSEVSQGGYAVYYAFAKGDYTIGEHAVKYSDTDTHWAKDYIDYVSARTLFSGTSPQEFSPDMTITRGMFITVLGRMHGLKIENMSTYSGYADVSESEYYAPYITWAKENAVFAPSGEYFYPDAPITRGEMALVISNYIELFGYKFNSFAVINQFEDLADCTDEIRAAILKIQAYSIINGKAPTRFDPNGTSTRAEASTVMTRLIKSILGVFYTSPYSDEYFTKEKIRIGAYANFDIDVLNENLLSAYGSVGFNMLLMNVEIGESAKRDMVFDYCDKNGIGVIASQSMDKDFAASSLKYFSHPSFYGSMLAEEPGMRDFDYIAERVDIFNTQLQNKKAFVNLLPLYSSAKQLEHGSMADYPQYYDADIAAYREYLLQYAQAVNSDIVMINLFPFGAHGLYDKYTQAVAITAEVADKYGKDFWCIIQSDSGITERNQLSRQFYTLLSFGCKNFILWPWTEGLCDAESRLTDTYYAAKEIIAELNAISDIFVQYEYIGAAVYNTSEPLDTSNFANIKSKIVEITELTSSQSVLVGEFKAKNNSSNAYTLLNLSQNEVTEIRLNLACESITTYFGGVPTVLEKNADGCFCITLEAGQGVFITE